jgi:hypothetical protein
MTIKQKEAHGKRWQAGLNSLVGFTKFLRKLELKTPNANFSSQHQEFLKRMGYKSKSKGALKLYEEHT